MIRAEGLSKRFGEVEAVKDVSLVAEAGQITGLLGPNGAGKTTTLRMLYGLITPDAGRVDIDGAIGVLPDSRGLYERLTARENVRYYGELQGLSGSDLETRIDRLLAMLELAELADRRTQGFSQGERVKVAIARALIHDPPNVMLDEPTNGLDVMSTRAMRQFLRNLADEGRCVLFSSHIMQEVAALTDRIVIVAGGRVVGAGTHEEILETTGQSSLEDAFVSAIGSEEGLFGLIGVVYKKELTDGLRDRRSLLSALLFGPLLGPVLFLALLGLTLEVEQQRAEKPLSIPVAGQEHAPNLVAFLRTEGVEILSAPEDPVAAVRADRADVVLVIPPGFGEEFREAKPAEVLLVLDHSRRTAQTATARIRGLLYGYGREVGALRLQLRGVDPMISRAVVVAEKDLSTPKSRGAAILAMLPYFMMFAVFIGSMYVAIDSTAGERERKSLEPLLITPVPRWKLMAGKLLATTTLGVVSLFLAVVAFAISSRFVPADRIGFELTVDARAALLTFLVVLPLALMVSALQVMISAFTKSFREAQTYVSLLFFIPMIPSFLLIVSPVKSKLWMATVPLLSQNLLIERLIRGEGVDWSFFLVAAGSTTIVGLLLALICARLYEREALLF